jgi:hypothetical protein
MMVSLLYWIYFFLIDFFPAAAPEKGNKIVNLPKDTIEYGTWIRELNSNPSVESHK